jgi:hypothetical protein
MMLEVTKYFSTRCSHLSRNKQLNGFIFIVTLVIFQTHFERGPPKYHSSQISFKLGKWNCVRFKMAGATKKVSSLVVYSCFIISHTLTAARFQRSLNVKAYDVPRTSDGHQVMAKDIMAFGHVSWKNISYYAIKTRRYDKNCVRFKMAGATKKVSSLVVYSCFIISHTLTAATWQWLV